MAAIIAAKIVPATLEFMDNFTIRTVEDFASTPDCRWTPRRCCSSRWMDTPGQVADEAEKVEPICKKLGATRIQVAQGRRRAQQGVGGPPRGPFRPGPGEPHHRAGRRHRAPQQDSRHDARPERHRQQVQAHHRHLATRGDGNLHPTILTDRRNTEEWHRVEAAIDEIFEVALGLGGTLSGEHGIGLAKSKYLERKPAAPPSCIPAASRKPWTPRAF